MKRVFKYRIDYGNPIVAMPQGAELLCVGLQGKEIMLWALVEKDNPKEERIFYILGTGSQVTDGLSYVGTVFDSRPSPGFQNGFVWHVWEAR